jgi:hypothetical protein
VQVQGVGRVRVFLSLAGAALCLGPLVLGPSASASTTSSTATANVRAGTATGTAAIRGVVLLGVAHTPVAGARVTLHGAGTESDPVTASGTSDAAGKFEFDGLAGGPDWTYTVTTEHSGVTFSTEVIGIDVAGTATVTLDVFETTTAAAPITRKDWTVWLDITGATMAVEQDVTIVNSAGTAYRTPQPLAGAPDKGNAAVLLPVAPGATNLQYVGWFEVCCDAIVGTTWAHTRPIPPGTTSGTMRYEAPTPASLFFLIDQPTTTFTVLAPQGTAVTSAQLTPAGTQTDKGTTYQVLRGGPLAAGSTVTLDLGSGSSVPWAAIVGAVGLLAVLSVALWWWRRSRPAIATPPRTAASTTTPSPASSKATPKPAAKATSQARSKASPNTTAKAPSTAASASKPTPTEPTTRSRPPGASAEHPTRTEPAAAPAAAAAPTRPEDAAELADELAMLDLAHERGALPDDGSYERVRASLVARLMAHMGSDPDALNPPKGAG